MMVDTGQSGSRQRRWPRFPAQVTRRWACVLLGCLLTAAWVGAAAALDELPRAGGFQRAVMIRVEGPITPILEQYLYRKLDQAREQNADLVILEIDSPGGFLHSSLQIADRLRDLNWARSVAFVPREALSGAAIAALGCDEIVMNPSARLGDAGPIFQGPDALFRHAPEKIRSDLVVRVRDLAEAKGRPPALAEAMVDMDRVVFAVKDRQTGAETFMSDAELASVQDPDRWEKGKPVLESRQGLFLTVNGRRAVELTLAEGLAEDRAALKDRFQLAGELRVLESSAVDTAVYILNLPLVTGLLFVIGLIALYVEFHAPGISVGGLISGLCFALFFWSRFLGGTSGILEIVLFVAGVIFLAVELFVLPGFGVAGVTGVLLMLTGVVMAGQDFIVPQSGRQLETLTGSLLVIVASGVAFIAAAIVLSRYLGQIPLLNRLALNPPAAEELDAPAAKDIPAGPTATPGGEPFPVQVGDLGAAESYLRPAGKAMFGDQYLDVVTDGSFVEKGCQVRVIDVSGNRVVVRKVDDVA